MLYQAKTMENNDGTTSVKLRSTITPSSLHTKTLTAVELLEEWMELCMYINSEQEDRIPGLKNLRTLTGRFLQEQRNESD